VSLDHKCRVDELLQLYYWCRRCSSYVPWYVALPFRDIQRNFFIFPGDFKRAYPTAKVIAPADAIKGHMDKELKFDGCVLSCPKSYFSILCLHLYLAWGGDPPDTKYGFEDEVSLTSIHLWFLKTEVRLFRWNICMPCINRRNFRISLFEKLFRRLQKQRCSLSSQGI